MNKVLIIAFSLIHCVVFAQKQDSTLYKNQIKIEELKKRLSQLEGKESLVSNCEEENKKLMLELRQYKDSVDKLNSLFSNTGIKERTKTKRSVLYYNIGEKFMNYEQNHDLDQIINDLKADNNIKIVLVGHTDKSGDEESNLSLSKERAENLKSYLISEKNIGANRIITEWYGSSIPAVKSAPLYSAENRRVEIYFVN